MQPACTSCPCTALDGAHAVFEQHKALLLTKQQLRKNIRKGGKHEQQAMPTSSSVAYSFGLLGAMLHDLFIQTLYKSQTLSVDSPDESQRQKTLLD